jgi:hypothetical protein
MQQNTAFDNYTRISRSVVLFVMFSHVELLFRSLDRESSVRT